MILAEYKKQLDNSAPQTAYATDTSFLKYERMSRAHYFIPASKAHGWFDECNKYDKLCETLKNWDPAKTLVASELAREFNAVGTDSSHKIKLLVRTFNSSIPSSEVVLKPKSKKQSWVKPHCHASSTKQEASIDN